MSNEKITDSSDFSTANSDWFGNSYVNDVQEIVSYRNNSTVRIWYNQEVENYKTHCHQALEIILPMENYYDVVINREQFRIMPGEFLIVPPRELHELKAPSVGRRFIFLFDLTPLSRMKGYTVIQPAFATPLYVTPDTFPDIYEETFQLLMKIRDEYFGRKPYGELTIYAHLISFLVKFGEQHTQSTDMFQSTQPFKHQEYIEKFNHLLEYIDAHYMEDLTLENMADATGFSKFHFARLFKQYTKFTFCDYLRFRRIKVSEVLLEQPELSITEVALQSGFPSISTFNRLFKEQKHCSPSEYRSMISVTKHKAQP